jgi:hypothetical protein
MTFIEYFTKYESNKLKCPSSKCHGEDNLGNYIYTTNKLTRFIDFHPTHNIEGYFYNILLQNMCFQRKLDLLSASNLQKNYVCECHIRKLVHDLDKIQMCLMKYAHRNLLEVEKRSQRLQEILEDHPYFDLHHKTLETIPPIINKQSH